MQTAQTASYFLLIFLLAGPAVLAHSTDNEEACNDVQFYLNKLQQIYNYTCGSGTPPEPPLTPVEWESIEPTRIGRINMDSTSTQSFVIPSSIPTTAREVLVYVHVLTGHKDDLFANLKVYTEASTTRQFIKYLPIRTYPQNAYSIVSENMWFPNPSNMRVYVSLSQSLGTDNISGVVKVIGYR